jgi:hypothetical protein
MRIDSTHKPWLIFTSIAILVGAAVYIPYEIDIPIPGGGTGIGLAFGSIALGLMLFAALLSLRKRFPIWRIGRTKIWMRAHLWLGFLALPMVLFHASFHARGGLTAVLMGLTVLVVVSGIVGAWLQHTLPSKMFREVPFETIYDQIPVICAQLVTEAKARAIDVTQRLAPATGPGATVVDSLLGIPTLESETEEFNHFFASDVLPFLEQEKTSASMLTNREWASEKFENFRRQLPPPAWEPITALEEICEEKRQLMHQTHLHRLLHGWLLIHLPFSAALILLAVIHAVGALRF